MTAERDPKDEGAALPPPPFRPPPRGSELPCDDGEPLETERHRHQMNLLADSLKDGWTARRDFFAGGNMALYFSELQSKRNDFRAPDVFVVLGVEPKERLSWVVWEEDGATPDVVIEILSPKTERVDRGEKMRIYANVLKVAAYYLYDPFTHVLEGYELDVSAKRYRRMSPTESGRLPCPPLGLELGLWEGEFQGYRIPWLRWFEPSGAVVPRDAEIAKRLLDEEARRADEAARRAEEEARRADEAARRAEEAARRAEEEARERSALEAQLAEYRARFGDLER